MQATPDLLTNLNASCDIAERMLLRGFKHLDTLPQATFSDFAKAVDILARVTAIRKSLIHLSERHSTGKPDVAARTSAKSYPPDSPSPVSDSDPEPVSDTPQSPDSSISTIQQTREIRQIPAMPLDRIQGALDRVMSDLAQLQPPAAPTTQSTQSTVHSPQSSTQPTQSTVLSPQSSTQPTQSTVLSPQSSVLPSSPPDSS